MEGDGKGKPPKDLVVEVINKGSAHQVIRKPVLKLLPTSGGPEIVIEGSDAEKFANLNVLSGKSRKVTLAWPKDLPVGPVKASIGFLKE